MANNSVLEAAQAYLQQGISVIPIRRAPGNEGKEPVGEWGPYQDVLPSPEKLTEWFTGTGHQIAMVTGCVSGGRFIIDFDGENWNEILDAFLEEFPEFVESLFVQTGSGRCHIHGYCPEMPREMTKKARQSYRQGLPKIKENKLGGIELRMNDHYTLCPPSLHPDGYGKSPEEADNFRYFFVDETKTPISISLERLNDIAAWIKGENNHGGTAYQTVDENVVVDNDSPLSDFTANQRRDLAIFYMKRLAGQCRRGENRNDKGYELARNLNNIGMPVEEAEDVMKQFQRLVPQVKSKDGHQDPYTIDEAINSLASAYTNPKSKPWIPPRFFRIDPKTGKYLEHGHVMDSEAITLLSYPQSEAGNAESFVFLSEDEFCFIKEMKTWYRFDGVRWDEEMNEVNLKMLDVIRAWGRCAEKIEDQDTRQALKKWCKSSESYKRIRDSVNLASDFLAKKLADFNSDSYLLSCRNGVVDLRTGGFREAIAEDWFLKTNGINYDPEAKCPRWLQFVNEIFNGNSGLFNYIQRAVGYTLTGDVKEQCFFTLHGTGANGKTVLLTVLRKLMGEYGQSAPSSAFKETNAVGTASPEIARLIGVRFVQSVEMKEHSRLNTERIKALTGTDQITARGLYKEPIEFDPTHKIWLAVNHKPIIDDDTTSTWRRVHLIPFNVRFAEPEKAQAGDLVQDKNLSNILTNELPGILNWAIEGCLRWQNEGLNPPPEVVKATEAYREESDVLGRYLEQRTISDTDAETKAADLYEDYKLWCEEEGEKPLNQTNFGRKLTEKGFTKRATVKGIVYQGIRLINQERAARLERMREMSLKRDSAEES